MTAFSAEVMPADQADMALVLQNVGIALGLGLLVGMQREHARSYLAGIRTFSLISVLGAMCGLLAQTFGGWVVAAGLVAVALLLVAGNLVSAAAGKESGGLTTEMAVLLMYGVGAYLVVGQRTVAIVVGAAVAVLLHLKRPLHQFVRRIGEDDLKVIMRFVVIALVILPVLPDRTYGPYDVLNPHEIWMMVVLIVGISMAGYVAYKLFGAHIGLLLAGVLGGMISSTATTVSYARQTREGGGAKVRAAVLVIMVASTMAFGRTLVEIAAVAPIFLQRAVLPFGVMLVWMMLLSAALYFVGRDGETELPPPNNPAELKTGLIFGAIYAVILLAVAAAKAHFGDQALYAVALISGLTDMDAITLSTSRLVEASRLEADLGWRLILSAALANLAFKAGAVALLGTSRLRLWIATLFGLAMAIGVLVIMLWPAQGERS